MRTETVRAAMLVLGGLLALVTAVLGVLVGVGDEWDSTRDRALWFLFSLGGPAVLALGLFLSVRRPSSGAIVAIVLGALLCGVATFWSIIIPLAAVIVAALSIVWGRRPAAA